MEIRLNGELKDTQYFSIVGHGAKQYVQRDKQGWTIAVPSSSSKDAIGLSSKAIIHGNFCLEAAYKIESLSAGSSGYGNGPGLYIATSVGAQRAALLARLERPKEGGVITATLAHSDSGGHRRYEPEFLSSQSLSGRLRLERRGDKLTYSVRYPRADWKEIRRLQFGSDPISTLRVALERGDASVPAKIHFTDIRLCLEHWPLAWSSKWKRRLLFALGALFLPVFMIFFWLLQDGWRPSLPPTITSNRD